MTEFEESIAKSLESLAETFKSLEQVVMSQINSTATTPTGDETIDNATTETSSSN